MFSFFWTGTWWGQAASDLAAFSSIIHSFLCEWTWILMGLLLVYYLITLKKRYILQTVFSIPCALFLTCFNFIRYPRIYEVISETIAVNNFQPRFSQPVLWISFFLAIPIFLAVLAAIVLCIVNLIRRRLFSTKQVLFLSLPIWLALGVHAVIWLCCGGSSPNRLIGYPELFLALMLTLTVTGKRQPTISNPENNPLSDSIGDNTGTRSE